jgi:hypothetical protein
MGKVMGTHNLGGTGNIGKRCALRSSIPWMLRLLENVGNTRRTSMPQLHPATKASPHVTLHAEMDCDVPSRSVFESDTNSDLRMRQHDNQSRSNELNDRHDLNSPIRIKPPVDAEADPPPSQDHSGRVEKGEAQCEREEQQQAAGNKRKRRRRNQDVRDQDDEDKRPHERPAESPTNAKHQGQGLKPKKKRESGAQKRRRKRERRDAYRNLERICARCQNYLEGEHLHYLTVVTTIFAECAPSATSTA